MNITDIDDKIIRRARQNHLFEQYIVENRDLQQSVEDVKAVMVHVQEWVSTATDPDKKFMLEKMLVRMTAAVEELEVSLKENKDEKIEEAKAVS